MTETTKLIQELVGLCEEKTRDYVFLYNETETSFNLHAIRKIKHDSSFLLSVMKSHKDAPAQLQAAIDKIKEM